MNGLNGDIALNIRNLHVGWVPASRYYNSNARRNLRVTVDIRMEYLTRQPSYRTTDHKVVTRPLDFSMSGAVWNLKGDDCLTCGQIVSDLRDITKFERGITGPQMIVLIGLWKQFHLNGMEAGCEHQRKFADVPDDIPERDRSKWLLRNEPVCAIPWPGDDPDSKEFKPYGWGRGWLLRTLPDWLTPDYVRELVHLPTDGTEN